MLPRPGDERLELAGAGDDAELVPRVDDVAPVEAEHFAPGVSAGVDMALHLVARLDSVEKARDVKRYIQYEPRTPV